MNGGRVPLRTSARLLIVAATAGGAVVLAVHLPSAASWGPLEATSWSLLVLAMVVTEQFPISLQHRGEGETFSVTDAIWVAALILVPPAVLVLAAAAGALIGQIVQRVALTKICFNLGQYLVGLALAVLVYQFLGAGPPTEPRTWLAATSSMAVFFLVNEAAVASIISLVSGKGLREVLLPSLPISILHWAGNMAIGILGAALWLTVPAATALLVAPLGLSYLAYRGWLRSMRERDEMREIARIADEITEQKDLARRLTVSDDGDAVGRLTTTLNEMLDRLERSFLRERRFLSEASHELRTPITVCRANLEVLAADSDRADAPATIALVVDELARMTRIVEDMMTLAQMEHPTFLRLEPVDLTLLLDEVAAKAQALLGDRLRTGPLPPQAVIHADRQRLTQALLNLLDNAKSHAKNGGSVRLQLRQVDGSWRVEVADEGGGLPSGREEELFEPFRRGTNRRPGSGLGLAIVKAVATAHGGAAGVDNQPSEGATFWIALPRPAAPRGPATPRAPKTHSR